MVEPLVETREAWSLIERVRVLDLGPNDRVVLECTEHLSEEEMLLLARQWVTEFPELQRPIILTGELTIAAVLRAADR